MSLTLTYGSIQRIFDGETGLNPVMKVENIKLLGTEIAVRYRLTLTDGKQTVNAMLATQHNELVNSKRLRESSIVKLLSFMPNKLNDQTILILLDVEILESAGNNSNSSPMVTSPQTVNQRPGQQSSFGSPIKPNNILPNNAATNYKQSPPPYGGNSAYGNPYAGNNPYGNTAAVNQPVYGNVNTNIYGGVSNNPYNPSVNSHAVVRDESLDGSVMPIQALNPYSNRWTIKARIMTKSDIRKFTNAKGNGSLFSIDLVDAKGDEIRGTFFGNAVDKWFPLLEEHKVYLFSGGKLKIADKKYNKLKNNYEITFDATSSITSVHDDAGIKIMTYSFAKISSLPNIDAGSTVDILGIVKHASECVELQSKKKPGTVLLKRDITIMDDSGTDVRVTLWDQKAQADHHWHENPIVAFKGLQVGDYDGRTLSAGSSSSFQLNPNIPEAHALNKWRFAQGSNLVSSSVSNAGGGKVANDSILTRMKVGTISSSGLGHTDKGDYFSIKGTINHIKHDNDPWYTACTTEGCNKKVTENNFSGAWRCEKCNKEIPNCNRRYILSLTMSDSTGQSWFSCFNDQAEVILGKSAEELYGYKMSNDEASYEGVFANALFKTFICRVRCKNEMVNDEPRLKSTLLNVSEVNYVSESKQLLDAIHKYV